jgi:hypothetical protein
MRSSEPTARSACRRCASSTTQIRTTARGGSRSSPSPSAVERADPLALQIEHFARIDTRRREGAGQRAATACRICA